ncbi:MAG: flagellin [Alteromonadaceae bacterium]|nr:flagellin [Alteromonadaceae bacterium]|tara:strand:- start:1108 stop:2256 length:1149 start_codon:yes stop_codon:yes gene_type:complete
MGLFVNTNVSALNAQRQLFDSSNRLSTAFEQLSSGFRINSAADDAAGLQISDRMTSQINGLNQAVRNANDAISLVQTADGALSETATSLQRIRQLAVQSQNGINSDSDNEAIQKEVDELISEIDRIKDDTTFAGTNILNGSYSTSFLVGANSIQTIDVGLTQFSGSGFGTSGLQITGFNALSGGLDSSEINGLTLGTIGINFGNDTVTGTYKFAISGDGGTSYKEISMDFIAGDETGNLIKYRDAVNAANIGVTATYNAGPPADVSTDSADFTIAENADNPSSESLPTYTGSGDPTGAIDGALSRVNGVRAELGALQNRFQSTIRNLSNISENLSASRSRIRDTDYAQATATLTQNQIIQQASTSILAQANQRPQAALSLLG